MKGYVFLLLTAFLLVTDAAHWGYPDLEKGEGGKPMGLDVISAINDDNLSDEGMMADQPATDDPDDDDDDDDDDGTTMGTDTTTDDDDDDDDDKKKDDNDDDDDDDDEDEFPKWGPVCDNGKYQSPIPLSIKTSLKAYLRNIDYDNYRFELEDARIVNNGHTVKIYKFKNELTVEGQVLPGTFILEELHFHWPSEHTLENLRYPLELHIVHRNKIYANISEAAKHADGIAVFAVLYHLSHTGLKEIDQILDRVDDVADSTHINSDRDIVGIEVRNLMPKDITDEYFTYKGSLTTPACAESVTWIVFETSLPVTMDQVEQFEKVEQSDGKTIKNNYRFLQKANNRKVIYVADDDDDGIDGIDSDNDGVSDDNDDDLLTNETPDEDESDNPKDAGENAGRISNGISLSAIVMSMVAYLINNRPVIF